MNKKQTLMVVLTGAALVAISQAQAQTAYQDDDLLLNFRSLSSGVPPNVTVDEGNINTFVTSVGYENTVDLAGAGGQFTAAGLLGAFGSGYPSSSKQIGFSAAAEDPAGSTLWLTRVISAPHANGAGLKVSAQQTADVQSATVTTIQSIGAGYTSDGAQLGAGNASEVPNADPNSYATQGVGIDSTLNFQNQTITAGAGGPIEGIQTGSTIYEALWEVPTLDSGLGDTYEGYFTFASNGDVQFTSAVPEPSTYVLIAGGVLLALAFRRQLRSLAA